MVKPFIYTDITNPFESKQNTTKKIRTEVSIPRFNPNGKPIIQKMYFYK